MWKELIQSFSREVKFAPPADDSALREAGATLGVELPSDFVALLRESDGVLGPYSLGLIWSLARINTANVECRTNAELKRQPCVGGATSAEVPEWSLSGKLQM